MARIFWIGGLDDWSKAGDWDPGRVPTVADFVIVATGQPMVTSAQSARSFTLEGYTAGQVTTKGAPLTIGTNFSLRDFASFIVNGNSPTPGALTVRGAATVSLQSTLSVGVSSSSTPAAASTMTAQELNLSGRLIVQAGTGPASVTVATPAPATLYGQVSLDSATLTSTSAATLSFSSGQIATIGKNGGVTLDGQRSRVADAGAPTSNSALRGLTSVVGFFALADGAAASTTGALANTGSVLVGSFGVTGADSSLAIGGALSNYGTLSIGQGFGGGASTVTATGLLNTGMVTLEGVGPTARGLLNIAAPAPATLTGEFSINGYSTLEFASGKIGAIDRAASLRIGGQNAFVANAANPLADTALDRLASNAGEFTLIAAGTRGIVGDFANAGRFEAADGVAFTVSGRLTNSGFTQIGAAFQAAATTLKVGALTNSAGSRTGGALSLLSNASAATTVTADGASTDTGSIWIDRFSTLHVDPSSSLTISEAPVGGATQYGLVDGPGTVVNDGTITLASDAAATPAASPRLSAGLITNTNGQIVSGTGQYAVLGVAGGRIDGGVVVEQGATLEIASIVSGAQLNFTGTGRVVIDDFASAPGGVQQLDFAATIRGFRSGSALQIGGFGNFSTVTALGAPVYSAGANTTTVNLLSGVAVVGSLTFAGNYSGQTFSVTPDAQHAGFVVVTTGNTVDRGDSATRIAFAGTQPVTTDTYSFYDGSVDDWATSTHWSKGAAPAATDDVVMTTGDVSLTTPFAIRSLEFAPNGPTPVLNIGASGTISGSVAGAGIVSLLPNSGSVSVTVGGHYGVNGGSLTLGDVNANASETLSVASLDNGGSVEVRGGLFGGSGAGRIDIRSAAPATLFGFWSLIGDAVVDYAGGSIGAIDSSAALSMSGAGARFADAADLSTNGALANLSQIAGTLSLSNGVHVATGAGLTITGSLSLNDSSFASPSTFIVNGAIANDGLLDIEDNSSTGVTEVDATGLTNVGAIRIVSGNGGIAALMPASAVLPSLPAGSALLSIAAPAPATLTGQIEITALGFATSALRYASGGIGAIAADASLTLTGATAFIESATDPTDENSGLTALTANAGLLDLEQGAFVRDRGDLTNTGRIAVDTAFNGGGSVLAVEGVLTNQGQINIGNGITGSSAVSVAHLVNRAGRLNGGGIDIFGGGSGIAYLETAGSSTNTGSIWVDQGGRAIVDVYGSLTMASASVNGATQYGAVAGPGTVNNEGAIVLLATAGATAADFAHPDLAVANIGDDGAIVGQGPYSVVGSAGGSVNGVGALVTTAGATLDVVSDVTDNELAFMPGAGTMILEDAAHSGGLVVTGLVAGDVLQLRKSGLGGAFTSIDGYAAVYDHRSHRTTLTLKSGGATVTTFLLAGDYSQASFGFATDAADATLIDVTTTQIVAPLSLTAEAANGLRGAGVAFAAPGGGRTVLDNAQEGGGVYVDLANGYELAAAAGEGFAGGVAGVDVRQTYYFSNAQDATGTAFDDRLFGTSAANVFRPGAGTDVVYGGGGSDTVDYSGLAAGVLVDLGAGYAYKETMAGVGWTNPTTAQTAPNGFTKDTLVGIVNADGTDFNDRLYGTSAANRFMPGLGADVVYGGGGTDTVDYSNLQAGVYVDLGAGYALKALTAGVGWSNVASAIAAGYQQDALVGLSNVAGSNSDDRLYGSAANNTFMPGMGNDVVYGGGGTDTIDYSNLQAGVYVNLGAKFAYKETLAGLGWTNVSAALSGPGAGFRTDSLNGVQNVVGSAYADRIYLASGPSTVSAGAGDDIVVAGVGSATIDAQGGHNTIVAGSGGGTFVSDASLDATGGTTNAFVYTGVGNAAYTIAAFTKGRDVIQIETNTGGIYDAPFGGATGALPAADFYAGASATIAANHPAVGFSYATDTHAVTFWSNGASTAFGVVGMAAGTLAASDFALIHAS